MKAGAAAHDAPTLVTRQKKQLCTPSNDVYKHGFYILFRECILPKATRCPHSKQVSPGKTVQPCLSV